MSSSLANTPPSSTELLDSLKAQLWAALPDKQIPILLKVMEIDEGGDQVVMDFILATEPQSLPNISAGRALQLLCRLQKESVRAFLAQHFSTGIVPLPAACQQDYSEIQTALMCERFEVADQLTLQKMCALAGPTAVKRKWLYFTEVKTFPVVDLQTLDQLWRVYSGGQFGFSQQRQVWLGVGKDWEKLWSKIAWKKGNLWTRYPNEFIWSLDAPLGHLPLTNQLRGVRVMDALMNHPAWKSANPEKNDKDTP